MNVWNNIPAVLYGNMFLEEKKKKKKIREKKEFFIVARYRGSLEYKSALNSWISVRGIYSSRERDYTTFIRFKRRINSAFSAKLCVEECIQKTDQVFQRFDQHGLHAHTGRTIETTFHYFTNWLKLLSLSLSLSLSLARIKYTIREIINRCDLHPWKSCR